MAKCGRCSSRGRRRSPTHCPYRRSIRVHPSTPHHIRQRSHDRRIDRRRRPVAVDEDRMQPRGARPQHVRQVRVADVHRLLGAHVRASQRVQEDVAVRLRRSDDRRRHHEVHQPRDLVRVQDRQQVAAPVGHDALHQPARLARLERGDRLRERLPLRRIGVPVVQRFARRADLLDRQIRARRRAARKSSTPSRTFAPPGPMRTNRARPRPAANRRTPPRPETARDARRSMAMPS